MADQGYTELSPMRNGDRIATEKLGVSTNAPKAQRIKIIVGAQGVDEGDVSAAKPLPVIITDISSVNPLLVTNDAVLPGNDFDDDLIGVLFKPVTSPKYAPLTYKDTGTVTKALVKAGAGNVFCIRVVNFNTSALRYFQLHNKVTIPLATEVPQLSFVLPLAVDATHPGILELTTNFFCPSEYFPAGIGWAISTTEDIFTDAATANEGRVKIRYSAG